MPQNQKRRRRSSWIKLGTLVIAAIALAAILIISFTDNPGPTYLKNWDQLTTKDHEAYFVYYAIETSTTARALETHLDQYLAVEGEILPIYYMDPQQVKGTPHPGIDVDVPVQLILVRDGEIQVVIDGPNAIARVLQAAREDKLKTYTPGHIIHWSDLTYKGSGMYFVYIYEPGSERHDEIKARIDAFNLENPMGITMYLMDKNAAYGIPNDVRPTIFGLPLAVTNPTIVVRNDSKNVQVARGLAKIIEILDLVDEETFTID